MALNVTYKFSGGSEFGPRDGWEVKILAGIGEYIQGVTNLATLNISTTNINYIFFEPTVYSTVIGGGAIQFSPGAPSIPLFVYGDPEISASQRSNYINYRTSSNWGVHPSTGFSFDLWLEQSTFPTANRNYATTWSWSNVNNGTFSLRPDKFSVFYQYSDQVLNGTTYRGPFAWGWQKGGTVNITATLDVF